MKVKDLENNIYNWKLTGYVVQGEDFRSRSKLHQRARKLLKDLFPTCLVLEEIPVRLSSNENGFFDFYVNSTRMVIEVHGSQHYKFNSLFHTSAQDFLKQKKKDKSKQDWCNLNNITYIELPHNEKDDEWRQKILGR